jgi:tetratricopeptide (TPR) repeat protein
MDPNSLLAIRILARSAEKTSSIGEVAVALRREAAWTEKPERAADLLVKSAAIHLNQMNDYHGAVANLRTALERCPEHAEAADRLTELLVEDGKVDLLIDALSRAATMTNDAARKAEILEKVSGLYADSKGDLSGAISAVARMLKAQPNNVPTMSRLVDLYKLNNQWDDAAKLLERIVKLKPKGEVLLNAHLDLAEIAEEHLGDTHRALQQIEALLKVNPKHEGALTMLLDLQFKLGKVDAASQAAERLYKSSRDPRVRADAVYCVGRVKLQKGARKSAAKYLREAVALAGPDTEAANEYRRLLGRDESWSNYAEALTTYQRQIKDIPDERDNMALTLCELARVQHEGEDDADRAIVTLRQGLDAIGDHPLLRYDLGLRLSATGRYKEAISELRQLLGRDPTNAATWRALAHTFRLQGFDAQAGAALAPLVVLEEATPSEKQESETHLARPGMAPPGSFGADVLWDLSPKTQGERELTDLLGALNDALSKVYPPDFQSYGLTTRDNLNASSNHPLRMVGDSLSKAFNLDNYDLYISYSRSQAATVALTQPVSIIAPGDITNLSIAEQVFQLARIFAYTARGQQAILKLGKEELIRVVAAATYKFSLDTGAFGTDTLERLGKRLIKATSWRGRKVVDEAAQQYASAGTIDFDRCLRSIESTATRAAALLCTDLSVAVSQIQQSAARLSALRGTALVDSSPIIKDLLSFWPSEKAAALSQRAGLL